VVGNTSFCKCFASSFCYFRTTPVSSTAGSISSSIKSTTVSHVPHKSGTSLLELLVGCFLSAQVVYPETKKERTAGSATELNPPPPSYPLHHTCSHDKP